MCWQTRDERLLPFFTFWIKNVGDRSVDVKLNLELQNDLLPVCYIRIRNKLRWFQNASVNVQRKAFVRTFLKHVLGII